MMNSERERVRVKVDEVWMVKREGEIGVEMVERVCYIG